VRRCSSSAGCRIH